MWMRLSRRLMTFLLSNKMLHRFVMEHARRLATAQAMRYTQEIFRREDPTQRGEDYVEIPVQVE